MKIAQTSLMICALLLAAGCANRVNRNGAYRTYRTTAPIIDETAAADRALEGVVRAQFNRYGDLASLAHDLGIQARNGMVTLNGTVPTQRDRRMILAVAENSPGVMTLNDHLQVSDTVTRTAVVDPLSVPPTGRAEVIRRPIAGDPGEMFNLHVQGLSDTDRTLAQRVLDGLRTDTMVSSTLPVVNINVADGKVILRGSVLNDDQRRSIVSAVQRAAGVNNVYDELQVQYPRR